MSSVQNNGRKKILITGGRGFIGRNLSEVLKNTYEVIAPSHEELDLLDEEKVETFFVQHSIDVVIHCANHDDSRNSLKDPTVALHNNLYMFFNLVKHKHLYGKMFYFGSGRAYDQRYYHSQMKEDELGQHLPIDDYGFSKYLMAQYIKNIPNIHELRIFGCFGKYEDWQIRFISYACCKALFDQDILIHQNRYMSYLDISDLAKIVILLMERDALQYPSYNVCPNEKFDLVTIAHKVLQIANKKLNVSVSSSELGKEYSGDNSRLLNEIGAFQFTSLEVSISKLFHWYQQNRATIDENVLLLNK